MSAPTPVKKVPIHLQSAQNRLYIKRGEIVNHDGRFAADVYIEDGVIKYVGPGADFVVPGGVRIIDAAGRFIIPGGVDPHTHFHLGKMEVADDFYHGTKAAIAGGTTTIIDFVFPETGQSMLEAYDDWRALADPKACCDYGLHMCITWWSKSVQKEMKILCQERGVNSFKTFMAYKDLWMLNDEQLYEVFDECRQIGAVAMVHAENGSIIVKNVEKLLNAGITGPEGHELSRNEEVEGEAVNRACIIAHQANAPIFITKVSSKLAAECLSQARLRGIMAFGEVLASSLACPINKIAPTNPNALYYVTSPPIRRDPETPRWLAKSLALDHLQVTATDNCTFTREAKEACKNDFTKIPFGVNGVEDRMSIVWEKGVQSGMIDPCRFVAITSTNAAKIFNIYPKKGRIEAGSDADIVIWNPTATRTISAETHHHNIDYNIFEGITCHGVPEIVIVKGRVCVDEGQVRVAEGYGSFIDCPVYPPFVYDALNGVTNGDKTNGDDQKIASGIEQLAIEIPPLDPLPKYLSKPSALSFSSDSTRASTPSGRAPRQDGQRNLQDSTFSISEELDNSEKRCSIRVRNPPGGKSSGLW